MLLEGLLDLPIGFWITAALLVFWAVGAYNRLVRLRVAAVQAFGLLESQWLRHLAWLELQALPAREEGAEDGALAPVPGWLAGLQPALLQFRACLQAAKASPLNPQVLGPLSSAWTVLRMAIQQAMASGEPGPAHLLQWEQMLLQDQAAVDGFNTAIDRYDQAVRQFPAILLAWVFAFRPARSL